MCVMVFKVVLKLNVWVWGGMGTKAGEKECSRIRIIEQSPSLATQWHYLQVLFKTMGP